MAISSHKYELESTTTFDSMVENVRSILSNTSFYDRVDVTDEEDNAKKVSAYIGEEEYFYIVLTPETTECEFKCKQASTISVVATSLYAIECGTAAMITFETINTIKSIVFCKSDNNTLMQMYSYPDQKRIAIGQNETETITVLRMEMREYGGSDVSSESSIIDVEEKDFLALINICGKRTDVYTAKNVTRIFYRQNNIPDTFSTDCTITIFTMKGKQYITDGYFCLYDDVGSSGGDQNG